MSRRSKKSQVKVEEAPETERQEPVIGTRDPNLGVYLGNGMWLKRN